MKLKLKKSALDTITQVNKQLKNAGGNFSGNETSGKFAIKGVVGNYKIEGDIATIEITDKPWLVSTEYVEGKIKEFFN